MFKLFKKNQKNVDKKPVREEPANKKYTDPELFQALQEDGIAVTEEEIQKARENDLDTFYKIGDIYYKKKKYEKAFAWFYKAALRYHEEAQTQVGTMYLLGEGVSVDYQQAMNWSMRAASARNAKCQRNIGYLYHYGWGVSKDRKQAMNWYLKAANNGNAEAMERIGSMYRDGEGVTKSIPSAIEWYTKAANQGNKYAQDSLGWIYKYEDGFIDLQKSVNWYQKAADNGHPFAEFKVEELNKKGYYAQEEQKEDKTIQGNNTTDIITNDQKLSSTSSSNDERLNKAINDKIEAIEKTFQSKMSLIETKYETNTDALQKELAALKQKELEHHEENRLLKERLARMEAGILDDAHNDLNYDSSENEHDSNNDINYDTECSNSEEEDDDDNNTTRTSQQHKTHHNLAETSADPNYDSSDNEDPRNDIYLD